MTRYVHKVVKYTFAVCCLSLISLSASLGAQAPVVLTGNLAWDPGYSDSTMLPQLTLSLENASIERILDSIAKVTGMTVLRNSDEINLEKRVSVKFENLRVDEVLKRLFAGTGYEGVVSNNAKTILLRNRTGSTPPGQGKETGGVSGIINDSASKAAIEGATVSIPRLNLSTVTGPDGRFSLSDVPAGQHQISIRSFGYRAFLRTITVKEGTTEQVNAVLASLPTSLHEVVTTVTGNKRRLELGSDIARIDPDVIRARTPVANVTDILEAAQLPGVVVTRSSGEPGSVSRIRIRGIGSINKSNDPLVIIDGVWLDGENGTQRMDALDPEMIETIEVVRGPSAATEYGQDAANGVIVITTKKGDIGPTRWNFNYGYDRGSPYGSKPIVYKGWGTEITSSRTRYCTVEDVADRECTQDSLLVFDLNHPLLNNEGTESNHRFTLSMDGGSNTMRYSITGSAQDNIGARELRPIDHIRYRILGVPTPASYLKPRSLSTRSIAGNFTLIPDDRWNLVIGVQANQRVLNDKRITMRGTTTSGGGPGAPDLDLNLDTLGFMTPGNVYSIDRASDPQNSLTSLYTFRGNWRPNTRWVMQGTLGMEKSQAEEGDMSFMTQCVVGRPCADSLGLRTQSSKSNSVYTVRFMSNYTPSLGRFDSFLELRPAFGVDYRKISHSALRASRDSILPGETGMSSGRPRLADYTSNANATAGWYLNTTVGLFRRLYFDVGLRHDIGSAITSSGSGYPKLSTSWLVSDESFWEPNNYIGMLRLRAALGYAAVQPEIQDIKGDYRSFYEFIDGRWMRVIRPVAPGNPRLKPEKAMEFELGFDTDILYDRVTLGVTYAHSINNNNLVQRNLAPSAGIGSGVQNTGSRFENIAKVINRNFELSFNARAIETENLYLVLNYNLTMTDNKVARLGDGVLPFNALGSSRIQEGYPIAGIWHRQIMGYTDRNGDGVLSDDEIILSDSTAYLGWPQPRYRAGYGVSLTVNNQWTFDSRFSYNSRYVQSLSYQDTYIRARQDPNSSLSDQALAMAGRFGARSVSDLAWNSASIGYQVPPQILRTLRARSLQIFLQGSNLNLWTSYIGRDPRVNFVNDSEGLMDTGKIMPQSRRYSLSLRWGF